MTETGRRIVLVDDDADLLTVTGTVLEMSGYEVETCTGGAEALRGFAEGRGCDLLLTDLQMPGMDGMELAERVTAARPELPVMLISGRVMDSDAMARVQGNGWVFLPKPFRIPELLAQVEALLRPKGQAAGQSVGERVEREAL